MFEMLLLVAQLDSGTADWYKSLQGINDSGGFYSCCDVSDCSPKRAVFVDGHWVTRSRYGKPDELFVVPDRRILKGKVSPYAEAGEGLAVVCETENISGNATRVTGSMGTSVSIYCFVIPPNFG